MTVRDLARPRHDINHVLVYGQSLSSGWEGWPALSVAPRTDSLMLGRSVRALEEAAPAWTPVDGAAFRPLAATVQPPGAGGPLSPDAVAALRPGDVALGETVAEAAVHGWRARQLAAGAASPGAARLLASVCGVGGRSIEALSRGAEPALFDRLTGCVAAARAAAEALGLSYGVAAWLLLQGENNVVGADGCLTDGPGYAARLARLHADVTAHVAQGAAGQGAAPALFIYQTSGDCADETLAIAQAQLDYALGHPGCFLAAPVYPVTSKGWHLDANGYRWLGAQFGKVMHRVLTLGQGWRPLHPLRARQDGRVLEVDFHVPVPPLRWGAPFAGHRRHQPREGGFAVRDSDGEVGIERIDIAGPCSLRMVLARPPGAGAVLRYADRTRQGRGCLHDSDGEVADECFAPDAAFGAPPAPDIAAVLGTPYPLMNWCTAFAMPIRPATQPVPLAAWGILR